jgi:hypothetical protein
MALDKLKELANQKAKVAALEKEVEKERQSKLKNLHADFGYDTPDALIAALRAVHGRRGPGRKPAAAKKAAPARRRKRSRITPAARAKIEAALKLGQTGSAVAREFGVSVATVQNIKKSLGLTKATRRKS